MTRPDPEREERRRQQSVVADSLKSSGALDEIFARIDAGEPLTGHDGLLKGMLKASLERGLEVELSDHVGYDRGDPDAAMFPNSRNGTFPKTVASEIGDIELAVPRDRDGTFTPMLVPKSVRRLDGLDAMIVSLYAGGMTIRDIGHHLVSTIGTELSHETISKVTDARRRAPGPLSSPPPARSPIRILPPRRDLCESLRYAWLSGPCWGWFCDRRGPNGVMRDRVPFAASQSRMASCAKTQLLPP